MVDQWGVVGDRFVAALPHGGKTGQTSLGIGFLRRKFVEKIRNVAEFIAYFPLADAFVPTHLLDLYADAGVDIVEFGWPAQDPYLDGADVRASMARAAEGNPRAAFNAARERLSSHRKAPKALIVTYAEPDHPALRDPDFFRDADATLILGPPEDARRSAMETSAREAGAGVSAFLPLPLTADDIAAATRADCYAMLQAASGVTGPRTSLDADNKARVAELRAKGVTVPIVLGFGISSGAQARAAVDYGADGVVVGSAVLRAALEGRGELEALLTKLREGLDAERKLFLGVDVGTTAIKGGLFDIEGRAVAYVRRPYPTARPSPGRVEQDPHDWVSGATAVMDELLSDGRAERVAAVGLCSQVNTDVFVDATGEPVAPAISWQDNRAAAEAAELDSGISAAEKNDWWGAPMPVGASHVLARMLWMARERPDLYARTRHVLTPKDYCLRALAGVAVADPMSNFFVVGRNLAYVKPLIARVAGAATRFPPLKFFTDIVGEIALGSTGVRAPVVAGTMDAWSGVFGAGVCEAVQGVYISGASEILALAGARVGAPGIVTFPDAAGLTVHAGPTQAGGDALRWWGEAVGRDVAGVIATAEAANRTGRPILFLPHLEGERAPLWDAALRGAFIGLDGQAKAPDFALAVMEGVALSARVLLASLEAAGGGAVPRLFHAGGGARSDLWAQIRADCLGRPLDRVAYLDAGCLGAAIMAAVGVGAHRSLADAVRSMTRVERTFEPHAAMKPRYDALYDSYVRAAQLLKPVGLIGGMRSRRAASAQVFPTPAGRGPFGDFGGHYVAPILISVLDRLEDGFEGACSDPALRKTFEDLPRRFVGRLTPLLKVSRLAGPSAGRGAI